MPINLCTNWNSISTENMDSANGRSYKDRHRSGMLELSTKCQDTEQAELSAHQARDQRDMDELLIPTMNSSAGVGN